MRLVQCGQTLREYHRTSVVMLPFRLIYSDDYYLPIGAHVFPAEKYRLVELRCLDFTSPEPAPFLPPPTPLPHDIPLVPKTGDVEKMTKSPLSPHSQTHMEIPHSPRPL